MSVAAMNGQVADTPAVREFLDRALEMASRQDCRAMAADCATKSSAIRAILAPGCSAADPERLREFLRSVFATRRRVAAVLEAAHAHGGLGAMLDRLCWGDTPPAERVDCFVDGLSALGDVELAGELAGEALHHTQPDRYWLCSRWMWSPVQRTGAMALVTTGAELTGPTAGATYLNIGGALLMVRASADAAGLLDLGPEPWNVDVLLACVYCVYLYTVTRLRMTQEFNKVIPPLPELARRLLGVHRLEDIFHGG